MEPELAALQQYVDTAELLERAGEDHELVMELLQLFLDDFPRLCDALDQAVHSSDASQIEKAAHALKGMFGSLSMKRASQLAAQVELAGRAADMGQVLQAMAELNREQAGLLPVIESFVAGSDT